MTGITASLVATIFGVESAISTFLGVVFGLVTGYYFEHRANVATREENKRLRKNLDKLEAAVASRHGQHQEPPEPPACTDALLERATSMQNESGRVRRSELESVMVRSGFDVDSVSKALAVLTEQQRANIDGEWIEIL